MTIKMKNIVASLISQIITIGVCLLVSHEFRTWIYEVYAQCAGLSLILHYFVINESSTLDRKILQTISIDVATVVILFFGWSTVTQDSSSLGLFIFPIAGLPLLLGSSCLFLILFKLLKIKNLVIRANYQ